MMKLRQSEAVGVRARIPFYLVDATDGFTPETGITVSTSDVQISKNGASFANFAGSWSELGVGLYYYTATASELDTLGFLWVKVVKAGVRTNIAMCQITTEDPYIARNVRGLVATDAGNTAATFKTNLASATTDIYKAPMLVRFLDGALAGVTRPLAVSSSFNGSTKFLTVSNAFTSTPANGTEFEIIGV
jgi:hypothetical protein